MVNRGLGQRAEDQSRIGQVGVQLDLGIVPVNLDAAAGEPVLFEQSGRRLGGQALAPRGEIVGRDTAQIGAAPCLVGDLGQRRVAIAPPAFQALGYQPVGFPSLAGALPYELGAGASF